MTNLSVGCGEVDHRKAVTKGHPQNLIFLINRIYIYIYIYIERERERERERAKELSLIHKQRCLQLLFVFDKEKRRGKMDEGGRGKWRMDRHLLFGGRNEK
jgi:hypothetical protein